MCVIRIVLYYFDMWLSISSPYHIAQHICEYFCSCVSRHFAIQCCFYECLHWKLSDIYPALREGSSDCSWTSTDYRFCKKNLKLKKYSLS